MLGWELPPVYAGGVGIVCNEILRELDKKDVEVTYIMPAGPRDFNVGHVKKLLVANNLFSDAKIKIKKVNTLLTAYQSSDEYDTAYAKQLKALGDSGTEPLYGKNMLEEVYRFAAKVALIAQDEDFDIIHAHDWTTFPAGLAAKRVSGKPLITHVHITEFNKTGGMHANPHIYAIEKEGMEKADMVVAISHLIKNLCTEKYFIEPNKIRVVHNGSTAMDDSVFYDGGDLKKKDKIVAFLGRVTLQKGPDYFVDTAKVVLDHDPNVTFIMAGSGDMLGSVIEKAASYGIAHKFIFHGFYTMADANKIYSMADVYIMPSVLEPFGVVGYEAMMKKTATIISHQTGMSEVAQNCLKIDFWDTRETAAKVLALLKYPTLNNTMSINGFYEAKKSTWEKPTSQCVNLYNELLGQSG